MNLPTIEEFREHVERYEEIYGISDCIYKGCIQEFNRISLTQLSEGHAIRIVRPFLLGWGSMQRVLGYKGVKAICDELKSDCEKIEPLRHKDFLSEDIGANKDLIIQLYDQIKMVRFEGKNGKQKRVGPTATAKVLHLASPNLFVMWDTSIRAKYRKYRADGIEYFEFLVEMKNIWKELKTTVEELHQKYGKSMTKILDQYNWMVRKVDIT